jgi:D-threonate/D-erythronate kinase
MDVDCLLIADDLTGACDAAVQFAVRGLAASVMLEMDEPPAGARVVAVSTESRHLAEQEIPPILARVAERYRAAVVFKKIDSVLRGNPGVEIAAALEAFGCEAAVATPAFPAMGRLVRGGRLSIGDVDVAAVLRSDAHVAPECVATASGRVISADAASDADLDYIVGQAMSTGRRVLWAGSAGLAGALARRRGEAAGEAPIPAKKRVLFCIGSDHPVTLEQIAALRRGRSDCTILTPAALDCMPGVLLLSGGDTASAVCRQAGARRIDLCGEVLPGIPWGMLRGGRFDGVPVVTKSGGFGAPDALIRIAEFFE